jgi:hypothetical protein
MSSEIPNEKVYKTPIYIRNAMRAYINRQKEKDIDLYNESRNQYNKNYRESKPTTEEKKLKKQEDAKKFKEANPDYFKQYYLKKKQKQVIDPIGERTEV